MAGQQGAQHFGQMWHNAVQGRRTGSELRRRIHNAELHMCVALLASYIDSKQLIACSRFHRLRSMYTLGQGIRCSPYSNHEQVVINNHKWSGPKGL